MSSVPDTVPVFGTDLELSHLSATICAELAAGLLDSEGAREKYNITEEQWDRLRQNPVFRRMLKASLEVFAGDMNAGKRITVKSEVALEDSIQILYQIAHNPELNPANRIDAVKTMAQLAGRNQKDAGQGAAGGGFNVAIHINTGDDKPQPVVIEGSAD